MGGWDHGPSTAVDEQSAETSARNSRYGLWLFALYCSAYALFVALNAFAPDAMTVKPWAGVPLSVLYGLGLARQIAAAAGRSGRRRRRGLM